MGWSGHGAASPIVALQELEPLKRPAVAIPLGHGSLLIGLVALQLWAGYGSNGTYDTYRDLFFARQITTGTELPLSGPPIFGTIHLSPLWYYAHAAMLAVIGNPASVPLLTALLAALRFPLAYLLGRNLLDARFGLLFAIALAMPGWSAFPLVTLTTPSVVETTVLLNALCALRYFRRPGVWRAGAVGLSAALALNAHPTTALPVALICATAFSCAGRNGVRTAHLIAAAAAALAPFVPSVLDQMAQGFPDVSSLAGYADQTLGAPDGGRFVPLLVAVVAYGCDYVLRYWMGIEGLELTALIAAHVAALAIAVLGIVLLLRDRGPPRRAAIAVGCLLALQNAFVLVLRPETPFWMVFAHLPLVAFLVALGLRRIVELGRLGSLAAASIALYWLITFGVSLEAIARGDSQLWVEISEPGGHGLMNIIQHPTARARVEVVRIPFAELDEIGEVPCGPFAVHGHYAKLLDRSFAVGVARHCGNADRLRLGGATPEHGGAALGLTKRVWAKLGLKPPQGRGSLGLVPVKAVWTQDVSLPIVGPRVYPPRSSRQGAGQVVLRGMADAADVVVVSNLVDEYFTFRFLTASADGQAVAPAYIDTSTVVLRCETCPPGSAVTWEIEVLGAPDFVDAVTFDPLGNLRPVAR